MLKVILTLIETLFLMCCLLLYAGGLYVAYTGYPLGLLVAAWFALGAILITKEEVSLWTHIK